MVVVQEMVVRLFVWRRRLLLRLLLLIHLVVMVKMVSRDGHRRMAADSTGWLKRRRLLLDTDDGLLVHDVLLRHQIQKL